MLPSTCILESIIHNKQIDECKDLLLVFKLLFSIKVQAIKDGTCPYCGSQYRKPSMLIYHIRRTRCHFLMFKDIDEAKKVLDEIKAGGIPLDEKNVKEYLIAKGYITED